MKRTALMLCFAFLVFLFFGCQSPASSENPASDFLYETSDDGTAIYITKYVGVSQHVIIPSFIDGLPVTAIQSLEENRITVGAFQGSAVKSVVIPEGVKAIKWGTFKDCEALTNITIPNTCTGIAGHAFENCVSLEKIDLSKTAASFIDICAFRGCIALKEILLPPSLLLIETGAFMDCSSLETLILPRDLKTVKEDAIVNCTSLKTITVPPSLELYAGANSVVINTPALENIIFEDGREEISGYAFFVVTSDVTITIPESVKRFSPAPFFLYGNPKFVFLGDFPELLDGGEFFGNPTIYYNPDKAGWDNCAWKDIYNLIPIT